MKTGDLSDVARQRGDPLAAAFAGARAAVGKGAVRRQGGQIRHLAGDRVEAAPALAGHRAGGNQPWV